ncbi:hypothetical protein [Murimonas intestini]|uniref:Uncharacterized protein n=1 Tax=Murimonas intestini TaxID=1337051 RepID=A0AB73SZV9_9FIRM|nr:hypothetical protein [Murimonas intestini]MCR1842773.1 hypothetical protein [Murimonas intestini]MCR1867888.1 hypothetical protein [Murimonas intestini]MCR1885240.1 hypothetical protein [Murimonas intestini]
MSTYYYESKSIEYMQGNFIDAETASKAKYLIWLKGACEYFDSFGDYIRDIKIRKVNKYLAE